MKAIFFLLSFVISLGALAGNEHGNGGDGYALEFMALGRKAAGEVRLHPDPRISEDSLRKAIETTNVTTKERLELQGVEVDAINYPEQKRIELNRSRWKEYGLDQKAALVLHEYLGVIGLDDSKYEISGKYFLASSQEGPQNTTSTSTREVEEEDKGNNFSMGIGAGYNVFGSNMGKLYDASAPGINLRLGYAFSSYFTVRAGFMQDAFKSVPEVEEPTAMSLNSVNLSLQYHWVQSRYLREQVGIDPYIFAGSGHTSRTQNYLYEQASESDSAFNFHAGIGSNLFFSARKAAFWLEGKMASISFTDRFQDDFSSGVPDKTGLLYSASAGLTYFF